jgi:hypothetical protein
VRKRQYWKDTHNNEEYTNKNKVDVNKFDKITINEVNDFYENLKDCNRNLINYGIGYESEDTTYGLFTYFISNLICFTKQVVQRRRIIKLLILFSQSQEILPILSVLFLQDLEVLNLTTKMLLQ